MYMIWIFNPERNVSTEPVIDIRNGMIDRQEVFSPCGYGSYYRMVLSTIIRQ
jgi:hypothetical protein